MPHIGSHTWTFGPQWVALFAEIIESLLEELHCWGWAVGMCACYSGHVDARAQHCRVLALFSSLVAFLGTNSGYKGCMASILISGPSYPLFLWILFFHEAQRDIPWSLLSHVALKSIKGELFSAVFNLTHTSFIKNANVCTGECLFTHMHLYTCLYRCMGIYLCIGKRPTYRCYPLRTVYLNFYCPWTHQAG